MKCKHLEEQEKSWTEHAWFAFSIASHMLVASVFIFIHAIFPWFTPAKPYDLEDSLKFLSAMYDILKKPPKK